MRVFLALVSDSSEVPCMGVPTSTCTRTYAYTAVNMFCSAIIVNLWMSKHSLGLTAVIIRCMKVNIKVGQWLGKAGRHS